MSDKENKEFVAIDLFCGCGGASEGLKQAGFSVYVSIDNNKDAVKGYSLNHPKTKVLCKDIRNISCDEILKNIPGGKVHLLSGCPPCQGFSSVRRLNRWQQKADKRNNLLKEYFRIVSGLLPDVIMFENVPAVEKYFLFKKMIVDLNALGYSLDYRVVNMKDYSVPQRRKRLFVVGSRLGEIKIAKPTSQQIYVKEALKDLVNVNTTTDEAHKIFANHTKNIKEMISLIPKDGGSRKDLPDSYTLECHKKENVGFNDIYGRLRWNDFSTTITGGCLNPSKGRFLHPEEDRCITAREAALLQTFPENYKFPTKDVSKTSIALMIGNALPTKFARIQAENILVHLQSNIKPI